MEPVSSIKPFKGWFYNTAKIGAYEKVVCPPYDVIDARKKAQCYENSPYNYCRVLLKEEGKTYKDLAERFKQWLHQGIFTQDAHEALYFYRQRFALGKTKHERVGIIGLLRVDDETLIYPHEYTHQKAKDDRLSVLKEVQSNLEPIFIITADPFKKTAVVYRAIKKSAPRLSFRDADGVQHDLWAVTDPETVIAIKKEFQHKKMVIADGHHRFEVSREYYQTIGKKEGIVDSNYILAYFTDCSSLTVLPTHRIVRLHRPCEQIKDTLQENGQVTEYRSLETMQKALYRAPLEDLAFGIYCEKKYLLYQQKKSLVLKKSRLPQENKVYANLDVFLLHKVIFDIMIKVPQNTEIAYTHADQEAISLADSQHACAFLVRATTLDEIIHLAQKGIRMPQKSTYFYPKVLSGMLLRRF